MCGIVGYITKNPNHYKKARRGFLRYALMLDTLRGPDSTGVITIDKKFTVSRYKTLMPGYRMAASEEFQEIPNGWCAIGHNRAATIGDITLENAHPFKFGKISLVHNGTLSHKGASLPTYDKDLAVDSMQIAKALSTVKPKEAPDMLERINGDFALVWVDERDRSINMARNHGRPLAIGFNNSKDLLLFMSDDRHLRTLVHVFRGTAAAIPNIYSLDAYKMLKWKRGSLRVEELAFRTFTKPRVRAPAVIGDYTPPATNTPRGKSGQDKSKKKTKSPSEIARERWKRNAEKAKSHMKDITPGPAAGKKLNRLVSPAFGEIVKNNTQTMLDALLEFFRTTPQELTSFVPGEAIDLGKGYQRVYGQVQNEGWGGCEWEAVIPVVNENMAIAHRNQPWLVRPVGLVDGLQTTGCPAVLCELIHCDYNKYEDSLENDPYTLDDEESKEKQKRLFQDPEGRLINANQLEQKLKNGCVNCHIALSVDEAWSYKYVNEGRDFLCEQCKWDQEIDDA